MNNNYTAAIILGVILAIVLIAVILCIEAWIVMLLWNSFAVPIFGLPLLSTQETLGLMIMAKLILSPVFTSNSKD